MHSIMKQHARLDIIESSRFNGEMAERSKALA